MIWNSGASRLHLLDSLLGEATNHLRVICPRSEAELYWVHGMKQRPGCSDVGSNAQEQASTERPL